MAQETPSGLDARAAELLARHFNTAFTTVSGYGSDHPMSARAGESLLQSLKEAFASESAVTLMMDRGALFIEKHPVGQRFNPRRLLNLLAQTKIESITFGPSVRQSDLQQLVEILSHQDQFPDVHAIVHAMGDREVRGIQLNYVTYRKVTADQKVVGHQEEGAAGGHAATSSKSNGHASPQDTFNSISSMMSLTELVRDPVAYASRLSEHGDDSKQRSQLVRQLRNLVSQIESGEMEAEGLLSSKELLKAVNSLRQKVRKQHDGQRDIELILSEQDPVLGEIDQLTYSTLVSLVREEYRGGNFSAKRMAQIIVRMLPDTRDLKRLLPQLKQGLLGEGMSLAEYGKLVHELSSEFRGDHLVQALESGADSVGLDIDEIVAQIREDPAEAARLIVMATELRRGGVDDENQLSSAFADYIHRVSEKLALDLGKPNGNGAGATDTQLNRVQQLLVDQLGRQGLPDDMTRRLQADLEKRRPPSSLPSQSASSGPEDPGSKPEAHPKATEQAQRPSAKSESKPEPENKLPELPQRVLNPVNTAFFLKREIKSAQRYKTPFSVIKVSIEFLRDSKGTPRRPAVADIGSLMPQVYEELIIQLRDLDLIGSLDKKLQSVPLMILPMTEQAGADIVRWRLTDLLRDKPFQLGTQQVQLISSITAVSYDSSTKEEGNAFVQRLQDQHERNRAALAGSAHEH